MCVCVGIVSRVVCVWGEGGGGVFGVCVPTPVKGGGGQKLEETPCHKI